MKQTMGDRIRLCRYNSGQVQSQFAESLGVSQSTLSKYENDSMVVPPEILAKLVQMGWSSDWLLLGKEEDNMHLEIQNSWDKQQTALERKRYAVIAMIRKLDEKQLKLIKSLLDQFNVT